MNPEIKSIVIDANNRNGTYDLLAERVSLWRHDREMRHRMNPRSPKDKEKILLEFARESQFASGIIVDGNLCGYVAIHDIDREKSSAEITIMIGNKNLWGAGIGPQAVEQTLTMFCGLRPENKNMLIHAFVRKSNRASWIMFQRLGFEERFNLDSLPTGYHFHPNDRLFVRQAGV